MCLCIVEIISHSSLLSTNIHDAITLYRYGSLELVAVAILAAGLTAARGISVTGCRCKEVSHFIFATNDSSKQALTSLNTGGRSGHGGLHPYLAQRHYIVGTFCRSPRSRQRLPLRCPYIKTRQHVCIVLRRMIRLSPRISQREMS